MAIEATDARGVPENEGPGDATPGRASLRAVVRRLRRLRWLPLVVTGALGLGISLPVGATNLHKSSPSEGLICTNGNAKADAKGLVTRSYVLTARDGYISTNDGNSIYMWSYAEGDKDFQYPGPFLCANQGDLVHLTLRNMLKVPTSIVFTGIAGVQVDGVDSRPESGGAVTGFSQPVAAKTPTATSSATYTFTATQPGTYLYGSGTDSQMQVQMGLEGGFIVRPSAPAATPANCAGPGDTGTVPCTYDPKRAFNFSYNTPFSRFNTSTEFVHLFSEVDPDLHHAVELNEQSADNPPLPSYDWSKYTSRYFMINGRSFPDDLSPNNTSAQPSQPYGSLVHVRPRCDATSIVVCLPGSQDYNPDAALIRYINAGPIAIPFHPHGNHEDIVGRDAHELVTPTGADGSVETFDTVVPPGGTIDARFTWVDAQQWSADTNPIKVPMPDQADRLEGPFWNGSPYLGNQQPLATGVTRYNECGEFYHFAHDHDLIHITSFGISGGGGQLTLVRVDPPPSLQQKFGVTCTVPGK